MNIYERTSRKNGMTVTGKKNRMKRKFRFVMSCVLCMAGWQWAAASDTTRVLQGGTARMLALGGSPSNFYFIDYTDIFFNPAHLRKFTNRALLELGSGFSNGSEYSANNQQYGATFAMGDIALGLVVGKCEGPMFADNSYGYQSGGFFRGCDYMKSALDSYLQNLLIQSSLEPLTPIQILCAFPMGDMSVGVALYRSTWSRDDDGTGSVSLGRRCSASLSQLGLKGGILLPLNSSLLLDVSGGIQMNSASSEYSNKNSDATLASSSFSATGYEVTLLGRMFYSLTAPITIVPLVRFEMFSYEPEVTSTPLSNFLFPLPNTYSKKEFEIGVGLQSRWERGLAVVGMSVQYISLKNEATNNIGSGPEMTTYSRTWLDLPKINAGIEFQITSWLIGRAGYFKRISTQRTRVEPPASSPPTESVLSSEPGFLPSFGLTAADQTVSLGLGFLVDRFALNGYLADQILGTGSYLLSGIQQSLFGVVSLSYYF
jgi:hypothetical protein